MKLVHVTCAFSLLGPRQPRYNAAPLVLPVPQIHEDVANLSGVFLNSGRTTYLASLLQNWGISNIKSVTKKTLLYCFKVAHTSLPSIIKKEENNAYVAVGCYITHQVVGKAVRISLK